MKKFNREEIIKRLSRNIGTTRKQSRFLLNSVLNTTIQMLADYGRVSIKEFGTFELYKRNSYYSTMDGGMIVPEKICVKFKPRKNFKNRINKK